MFQTSAILSFSFKDIIQYIYPWEARPLQESLLAEGLKVFPSNRASVAACCVVKIFRIIVVRISSLVFYPSNSTPTSAKPCMFELEGKCPWGKDCSYIHRPQSVVPAVLASTYTPPFYSYAETTASSSTLEDRILQHSANISSTTNGPLTSPPSTADISAIDHALRTLSLPDTGTQQRRRHPARTCYYRS